jgi:diacylglycerol kinase (ATP)
MRARWIFNSNAGSAAAFEALRPRIEAMGGQHLCPTTDPAHTTDAVSCCLTEGFDTVIACGGDGTVNSVVTGLMHCDAKRPVLGVLPVGTGNDFARTLGMPLDGDAAIDALLAAQIRPCDVARVYANRADPSVPTARRYFINVSAGGFSGQVNEATTDEVKSTWGPLAYVRSALSVLPDLTRYQATLRFDDEPPRTAEVVNVIVANARTAAGGTAVAPYAAIEDGMLDVVIVHGGTMLDLAGVAARLLAGDYTASDIVELRRCRRVSVVSDPPMAFNVDGDLLDPGPLDFELLPGALRVLVGPDYVATVPHPDADPAQEQSR